MATLGVEFKLETKSFKEDQVNIISTLHCVSAQCGGRTTMLGAIDALNKKLITYLLKRSFGPYVKNFNVDQFSLSLSSGTGVLKDVDLNCGEINMLLEAQNVPFEILEGHATAISMTVPWFQILSESCQVNIDGLYLHLQPKNRSHKENPSPESMLSSMFPSVLAENFKTEEFPNYFDVGEAMPAVRNVEDTITSVIFNVRCHLENTVIRYEPAENLGLLFRTALELNIKSFKILAEPGESENSENLDVNNVFFRKLILLDGVSLDLDCFQKSSPFDNVASDKKHFEDSLIPLLKCNGVQECHVEIKFENEGALKVDFQIETLLAVLSPTQLQILQLIFVDFGDDSSAYSALKSQIQPGIPFKRWTSSADSFEENDKYMSLQPAIDHGYRSFVEPGNSSSSIPESTSRRIQRGGLGDNSSTVSSMVSKLAIQCKTAVVVVLQEDILTINSNRDDVASSFRNMQVYADNWFTGFAETCFSDSSEVIFQLKLSSAGKSHMQLLVKDILVESTISSDYESGSTAEGSISFGNFELNEFLACGLLPNPSCRSKLNKILCCLPGLSSRIYFKISILEEKMDANFRLELSKFIGEIDPSIIDRLGSILEPERIHTRTMVQQSSECFPKFNLQLSLEELDLDFRVPTPNMDSTYLVRNLRADCINFAVRSILLSNIDSEQEIFQPKLSFREAEVFYKANSNGNSVKLVGIRSPSPGSNNVINFTFHPPQPVMKRKEDHEINNTKNFGQRMITCNEDDFSKIKNESCENVQVMVSCKLSSFQIFIPSKDLLDSMMQPSQFQLFGEASSTMGYDSDTETFHSAVFGALPSIPISIPSFSKPQKDIPLGRAQFVLGIQISDATISLLTPFKDVENTFILGSCGQITVAACNINAFFASKYKDNPDADYVGFRCQEVSVLHCQLVKDQREFLLLDNPQMERILEPSDPSITSCFDLLTKSPNQSDVMLALAVTLNRDKFEQIADVTVFLGLQNATFNHIITLPNRDCFSQLVDFFGTNNETNSSLSLQALHVNLANITLAYAPKQDELNAQMLVMLEQITALLYMNVTDKTTIVHFVAENAGLLLTDKKGSSDIINEYVRVIDIDLFKLLVKIYDTQNEGHEIHLEMGGCESLWNISACSDTLKMLLDLATYVANDGDLVGLEEYLRFKASPNCNSELQHLDVPVNLLSEDTEYSSELFRRNMNDAMKPLDEQGQVPLIFPAAQVSSEKEHSSEALESGCDNYSTTAHSKDSRLYPSLNSLMNDPIRALVESVADLSANIELSANERSGETQIDEPFEFVDNYFVDTEIHKDFSKSPEQFPKAVKSCNIDDISIHISLFGGRDFGRGYELSTEDIQSNSDNNLSQGTEDNDLSFRNNEKLVEFHVQRLQFHHDSYPETTKQASRQVLTVHRFEVTDNVKTSRFKKVLYLDELSDVIKEENPDMLIIKAKHVRPEEKIKLEECFLTIHLMPLQVTLDQETLIFLLKYFEGLLPLADESSSEVLKATEVGKENTQVVYSVDEDVTLVKTTLVEHPAPSSPRIPNVEKRPKVYFREIIFSPDVPIRIDYKGKMAFDFVSPTMKGGLTSLLMGLGQLDNAKIKLVALRNERGVLGVENVIYYLTSEWAADISKHQFPTILKGVDIFLPANAFIQLYQGVKDLFILPAAQYRRDGNLIYGVQLGLTAFSSSTVDALLQLTNRLVLAVQKTAEVTYDIVSSGQSIDQERQAFALRSHPSGIVDGVTNACSAIVDGVGSTASNFVTAANAGSASKGIPGAIGGVLREIPPALVKPVIIAAEATTNVIEGAKAQFNPNLKREFDEKRK
ncbi:unnamed protein product [Allacma fusca]|uniref:Autophagy-related protein 2 n=1 Tax=Allacma fusca TaxID=39272 RepID=A0A8J2M810_9HEXA|nr:unnamed protein product [Allacma fusca]